MSALAPIPHDNSELRRFMEEYQRALKAPDERERQIRMIQERIVELAGEEELQRWNKSIAAANRLDAQVEILEWVLRSVFSAVPWPRGGE
jgi:hypothetical protein